MDFIFVGTLLSEHINPIDRIILIFLYIQADVNHIKKRVQFDSVIL